MGQKTLFALRLLAPFFALGSLSAVFATSTLPGCGLDVLSNYVTNTAFPPTTGGCAIGILDYYNFSYHPVSNAPLASAIQVSPDATGFSFSGLSGAAITAAAGTTVQFEIDYQIVIDPAPILSGGDLQFDPPKGDVTVTEYFCNDIPYSYTGLCLGGTTPDTLTLHTLSCGSFPCSATITFPDPALKSQQVGLLFTLVGGTTGASFDSLSADAIVVASPEPVAAGGIFVGLLTLGAGYKLRKRNKR